MPLIKNKQTIEPKKEVSKGKYEKKIDRRGWCSLCYMEEEHSCKMDGVSHLPDNYKCTHKK
ncbi:MAG TPA: hypothetical protein VK590_02060 [Saprospiraceae bacterium]|nr:hypothetical protein [Saprospiraceae bacterium]